jgi:pimeloyl-ACP methyl ester carboxylesterase
MNATAKQVLIKSIGLYLNTLSVVAPNKAGQYGLRLFSTPQKARFKPGDEDYLLQVDHRQTLTSEVGAIQSYSWNAKGAKTILLLHGWESNAARWRWLLPFLLEQNWKVAAIDAPGHGASSGKLFNYLKYAAAINVANQLYQPDFVLGHSAGGSALAYFLTHYPAPDIKKAALMGVPSELRSMADRFAAVLGLSGLSQKRLEQAIEQDAKRPLDYFSVAAFCQKISIPTLVLHDEQDTVALVKDARLFHEQLPQSELVITDGYGHSMQDKEVYQQIVSFFS